MIAILKVIENIKPFERRFYLQPRFMHSKVYNFTQLLSLTRSQITFTSSGGLCRGEEVSRHIALQNEKGREENTSQKETKD